MTAVIAPSEATDVELNDDDFLIARIFDKHGGQLLEDVFAQHVDGEIVAAFFNDRRRTITAHGAALYHDGREVRRSRFSSPMHMTHRSTLEVRWIARRGGE